jgi:hypothetical protein
MVGFLFRKRHDITNKCIPHFKKGGAEEKKALSLGTHTVALQLTMILPQLPLCLL